MSRDVPNRFRAAERVADDRRVTNVERVEQRRDIVGERVVVVAAPGVARAAVAPPIERDGAVSASDDAGHLILPERGIETPPMQEDDRLARAPVAMKQRGSIFRSNVRDGT